MENIRERLGLDFLQPANPQDAKQPRGEDPALTSALMAYGWRVLDSLAKSDGGTATVYELIDRVQIPIEIALKLVDYFESLGIIQVIQRDLKGDHSLAITPAGRDMLKQSTAV